MKAGFIFVLLFVFTFLEANAQCPEVKKQSSINNTITISLNQVSKYTAAVLYKVENGQPFLNFDAKPELNHNNISFTNLPVGNYIVRINEKGCNPLFIGKQENINIK
ncbi:MAG: hypothetical protein V4667_07440 [Bacteroidota bacterium]